MTRHRLRLLMDHTLIPLFHGNKAETKPMY
mgnify:CR=1 FL=1